MRETDTARVTAIVADLSLEEKVAQLGTVRIGTLLDGEAFSRDRARAAIPHGIGRVTRVGRESRLAPAPLARVLDDLQTFLVEETRPGIPAICREEATCGYAGKRGTVFPQGIGMASTWDPALVERVADEIAGQLRAVGCQATLSPVLDLGLDPRWGRIEETYGEDPYLVSRLGAAAVDGFQGGTRGSVAATVKHFVGHGRPEGGRNRAPVTCSHRTLKENDRRPFRAAVERSRVESVMAAYHAVDGVPCHADERLLTGVLRREWGFDGTVVSDGRGVELLCDAHHVVPDRAVAGVAALRAGIDVELPETECFGESLVAAVRSGSLEETAVDRSLRRHLAQKSRLGLLDASPIRDSRTRDRSIEAAFDADAPRRLARRAGIESLVLLANDGTLPLTAPTNVAVVGPSADEPRHLLGSYAYAAAESDDDGLSIPTPLDAIRGRVGQTAVRYERGCGVQTADDPPRTGSRGFPAAVDAAAAADVVVAFLGGRSAIAVERDATGTAGEGLDRATLSLPGRQQALLDAVVGTGTPVVVVLVNGRPLALASAARGSDTGDAERAADGPAAVLEAWLPGQAGALAIADVLFGDADPGGRLPVSIPRSVGQLPVHYRRTELSASQQYVDESAEPWYPFGHGESYAGFEYENLAVEATTVGTGDALALSVDVVNTTDRAGTEVVQLYVRDCEASVTRPVRELRGFHRLSIPPGARRTVSFSLPVDALALVDRDARWLVEPGQFELQLGRSSADVRLREPVTVDGDPAAPDSPVAFASSTVDP